MDSVLLIVVALVALAAILWIALTVIRGGRTRSAAPDAPQTSAYQRELAEAADARSGALPTGRTDAGADNLRTGAAAGTVSAATTPADGPVSAAYEAELAEAGVRRTAPPTTPDAPEHTGNLRTDVGAGDGTVAPPPYINAAVGQVGIGHAGVMGQATGAGVAAGAAADAAARADAGLSATPNTEEEMAEEILRRREQADQVERDLRDAQAMGDNAARSAAGSTPLRADGPAEDFIETPLPDPAPADAAAATGGLGSVVLDEPDAARAPHDRDERPTPGVTT